MDLAKLIFGTDLITSFSFVSTMISLLFLILFFFVARWGLRRAEGWLMAYLDPRVNRLERRTRIKWLIRGGYEVSAVILSFVIVVMALRVLGFDIVPFLAGAGLVGLAISLGAQTLIRDYLGGIFILIEDQFEVGDVIEVGGKRGVVTYIALRATHLRGDNDEQHVVPNGEVRAVTKFPKS